MEFRRADELPFSKPLVIEKEGRVAISRKSRHPDILVDLPLAISRFIQDARPEITVFRRGKLLMRETGKLWRTRSGNITLKFRFAKSEALYFLGIKRVPLRIVIDAGGRNIRVFTELRRDENGAGKREKKRTWEKKSLQ